MAVQAGSNSKVMIGANTVLKVKKVDFKPDCELPSLLSLNETWDTKLVGTKKIAGTITCYLDPTDTTGQMALQSAFINGSTVTPKIYVSATNYWTGNAFIKGISVSIGAGGTPTEVSFDFESDGAWTYT